MTPHALDLWYYTSAKTMATNEAIAVIMPMFVAKVTDIKNKHLWRYVVNLIDNLEPLQSTYFRKQN